MLLLKMLLFMVYKFFIPGEESENNQKAIFNGTLTDGNKSMRLVGFDDKQQQQLKQLMR